MAEILADMNSRPAPAHRPTWLPPVSGLLVAAALTVAGLAPDGAWPRLGTAAAGAALALLAGALVVAVRTREGIRGAWGGIRRRWAVVVLSCAAILLCSLGASPELRRMYVAAGVLGGGAMWVALRRERPRPTASTV
ncbi:hypothetical protein ACFUN8_01075 [Streptomyces sp. NPDC057307]|uniref:hypothetical protein n=1 Tax=Streptomyces sp. NPDC057307 TaxID=3346096 RepID=UPI00363991A0